MKLVIGTHNPAKVQAAEAVFGQQWQVEEATVASNVSPQPFSDKETLEGALNRAKACAQLAGDGAGIGLEGGVTLLEGKLYLCNWGALVYQEKVYTASGAKIVLPEEIAADLQKGEELADVMDRYVQRTGIRSKEGAIGIFTNGAVSRTEMFHHVCLLLKGQFEYSKK